MVIKELITFHLNIDLGKYIVYINIALCICHKLWVNYETF